MLNKISLDEAIDHLEKLGFDLIGAGSNTSSPTEMLASSAFGDLISQMRNRYDLIILDSAPILNVADALTTSRYADFVLVAVRYAKDSLEGVAEALSLLDKAEVKNRALVINRILSDEISHYGYGYGYG